MSKNILVWDSETTGLVKKKEADINKQPYIVQYAHALINTDGKHWDVEEIQNRLFNVPVVIPQRAIDVHGITNERIRGKAMIYSALEEIISKMEEVDIIVGHNVRFDMNMLFIEAKRMGIHKRLEPLGNKLLDTMHLSKNEVQAKNSKGSLKFPTLGETYQHFFGHEFDNSHDALADVMATVEVLEQLFRRQIVDLTGKLLLPDSDKK